MRRIRGLLGPAYRPLPFTCSARTVERPPALELSKKRNRLPSHMHEIVFDLYDPG